MENTPKMTFDSLEANPHIRYGFYLRPSFEMSRAQTEIHDILKRQFGLQVGGKFMPHATIMSFFRSDAPVSRIEAAISAAIRGQVPFTVTNGGPKPHKRSGVSLDVHHNPDGTPNQAMQKMHEAAFAAIIPLVHPDCEFSYGDWSGTNFRAHLTLAMADIPDFLFDEVLEFIESAGQIGPRQFVAEYFHLYAFHSEDWGGAWWKTMTWHLLTSWKMAS
jgi:2'-5' RNA ligase